MHQVAALLALTLLGAVAAVGVDGPAGTPAVGVSPGGAPASAAPRGTPAPQRAAPAPPAGSAALGMPWPPGPASVRGEAGRPWQWPIQPRPRVVQAFRPPLQPWGAGHRGVDLAADHADTGGAVVRAPQGGVLTYADVVAGRAVLVLTHPGGLRSSFEPVLGTLPTGTAVRAGDPIGVLVGSPLSHCAPVCLHWGVRRGTTYLDPLALIRGRAVLLPLRDRA